MSLLKRTAKWLAWAFCAFLAVAALYVAALFWVSISSGDAVDRLASMLNLERSKARIERVLADNVYEEYAAVKALQDTHIVLGLPPRPEFEKLDSELRNLRTMIEDDIASLLTHANRGGLLAEWEHYRQSEFKAYDSDPFPFDISGFGKELYGRGEYVIASEFLWRSEKIIDFPYMHTEMLAVSYLLQGQPELSLAECKDAGAVVNAASRFADEESSREFDLSRAWVALCIGEARDALETRKGENEFRKVLEYVNKPDFPESDRVWLRCSAKAYLGHSDALKDCLEYETASPEDPNAKAMLGLAHHKQGHASLAVEKLEQAVRMDPNAKLYQRWLDEAQTGA